jgi:hypothetical protein
MEQRTRPSGRHAAGRSVKFPTWFSALAYGDTPMCAALSRAAAILAPWLDDHPGCFPPVVVNITDGASTDGDPRPAAEALQGLTSADGHVLLFNLHLSSDHGEPVVFPVTDVDLPDDYARQLLRMSSPLPHQMLAAAARQDLELDEGARGFGFNADISAIVQFLDVGTQVLELR